MTEREKVLEKMLQEYSEHCRNENVPFVVKEKSTSNGDESKPVWAKLIIAGIGATLVVGCDETTCPPPFQTSMKKQIVL